ncbi:MAG: hypothetical protein AAFY71_22000 [Bacteroidota bacterium]
MDYDLYYQPSGKIPAQGILLSLLGIILTALILGFVYAHAIYYIPLIYVRVLMTLAAGAAMGYVPRYLIKAGKIRNGLAAPIMSLMGGVLLLYVHWPIWVSLVLNQASGNGAMATPAVFLADMLNPSLLWGKIQIINATGTWALEDSTFNDDVLWFVWIVEALIIVGMATFVGWRTESVPFDEKYGSWAQTIDLPKRFQYVGENEAFKSSLEQGNYEFLASLPPQNNPNDHFSKVKLFHLPDSDIFYFSLINTNRSQDKKGNEQLKEKTFIRQIRVQGDVIRDIFNLNLQPTP